MTEVSAPSPQAEIHDLFRLREDLPQEILVAVPLVVLQNAQDPEIAVIHDRVDVLLDRRFAAERGDRSLFALRIAVKIVIDVQALVSVRRPDPTVSLDAVKNELPAIQMERIRGDVKHTVQDVVVFRPEEASLREREHFRLCADLHAGERCGCFRIERYAVRR